MNTRIPKSYQQNVQLKGLKSVYKRNSRFGKYNLSQTNGTVTEAPNSYSYVDIGEASINTSVSNEKDTHF